MPKLQPGHVRMIVDPQVFATYTGKAFRGLSFHKVADGWRVILKATKRDGTFVYSLFAAGELEDAIHGILTMVSSKGGERYWHPDRFA